VLSCQSGPAAPYACRRSVRFESQQHVPAEAALVRSGFRLSNRLHGVRFEGQQQTQAPDGGARSIDVRPLQVYIYTYVHVDQRDVQSCTTRAQFCALDAAQVVHNLVATRALCARLSRRLHILNIRQAGHIVHEEGVGSLHILHTSVEHAIAMSICSCKVLPA
jgi:hypothetical protein